MPAPLHGLRVLDLSAVVSGPMAAGILADQGAEVIKVEPPKGDLTRVIGPASGDLSALFASINRGKRSIVLDLKQPEGLAVVRTLIARADVLIENFRPGAMDRLGLGSEALAALNPRLVYLSISGFGPTGPYAGFRVYDPVIQAVSGFADAHPDPATGEPQLLQTLLCDKITALTAAQAITAALHARHQTGRGQQVDLSMLDAALSFLWPEALYNHSLLDAGLPPTVEFGAHQKLWQAQDGWIAMITPQDDEFRAMCQALGVPALASDPRFVSIPQRRQHQPALRALIEPLLRTETVDTLVRRLGDAGVPVGRVNRKADLAHDPQIQCNASLAETPYPGLGRVRTPQAAARFGGAPAGSPARAPHLGEHTRDVLAELGHGPEAIAQLLASGAARAYSGTGG